VVLIGRPQHVEAVQRQGLRLETQTFDEHVRVSASTEGSAVKGAQLVLFCVMSTDTESAAAAMKPHLAPDTLVLSLQNGVENADRLRALLQQEVVAAAVSGPKWPGHVRHHGCGELVIEQSKASDNIARVDRGRRSDRYFRRRAWRVMGEADPELRVQSCLRKREFTVMSASLTGDPPAFSQTVEAIPKYCIASEPAARTAETIRA
jgi:ketopantoate reductase